MRRGMPETPTSWLTVVGVVDDVKLDRPMERQQNSSISLQLSKFISEGAFALAGELDRYLRFYTSCNTGILRSSWRTRFWPPSERSILNLPWSTCR